MKSTIVWVVAAVLSFVLLVIVIFIVLYQANPENMDLEKEAILSDDFLADTYLEEKDLMIDSLSTVIDELNSVIFFKNLNIDSVAQIVGFQEGLITEYRSSLKKANDKINSKKVANLKLQEIAKTYESMKVAEIRPIIAELNDQTVLDLYKFTGARNRKNILKALSSKRAAAITELMAKGD